MILTARTFLLDDQQGQTRRCRAPAAGLNAAFYKKTCRTHVRRVLPSFCRSLQVSTWLKPLFLLGKTMISRIAKPTSPEVVQLSKIFLEAFLTRFRGPFGPPERRPGPSTGPRRRASGKSTENVDRSKTIVFCM
jgi:hypothetical protein